MSDLKEQEQEQPKSKGLGKVALILSLVVGIAVGGGAGAFVAGPLLAKKVAHSIAITASVAKSSPEESKGDKGHDAVQAAYHVLEDIVLNPAQSGGTRFLATTVSIAVADTATVSELKNRDAEVRDAVIGVLGTKSVVQLADIETRDSLKAEISTALDALLAREAVHAVFFPKFVIQ